MGFFGLITADTKNDIVCQYASKEQFDFTVVYPDGKRIRSSFYDGYGNIAGEDENGEFIQRDFFGVIAQFEEPKKWCQILERNNGNIFDADKEIRRIGIDLYFNNENKESLKCPKFVENDNGQEWDKLPYPDKSKSQSFFF